MANKISTEELLERMKQNTETVDLGWIAKLCHEYDVCINIEWSKDVTELFVRPN